MRNPKVERIAITLLAALIPAFALGCRKEKQPQLPAKPPPAVKQEFTGKEEGFPPRVRGRTNEAIVPVQEVGLLTDARAVQLREAALQDSRVTQMLGARSAYITIDEIEPEKGKAVDPNRALTRITFFSYSNNAAVYVRMSGQEVESVTRKDGFQPPEGREEIREAVALASRDGNLRGKLEGLTGRGILSYTPEGRPESGHRVLRITFRMGDEDVPRYFAMVDLTDQKVLSAGAVNDENKEQKP